MGYIYALFTEYLKLKEENYETKFYRKLYISKKCGKVDVISFYQLFVASVLPVLKEYQQLLENLFYNILR